MPPRVPPGPAGTSCLTCKQRHKRCDKRQPECEKCLKGGYECLGYGHIRSATGSKSRGSRVQPVVSMEQRDNRSTRPVDSTLSAINAANGSPESSSVEAHFENLDNIVSSSSSPSNSRDEGHNNQVARRRNKNTHILTSARNTTYHQPFPASNRTPLGDSRAGPSPQQLFAFSTRIPHTPFGEPSFFFHSITFEDYVIAHSETMMELSYFKPIQNQTDRFRRSILARLQSSSFSRWVMFLCVRICESFCKGDASQNQIYNRWIGDVERALKSALTQDLASREAQERLGDCLEIQLLKTMMGHSSSTYQVLRTVTPTFLQTVFSDPELWSNSHNPTSVPLGPIIASTRHGLAQFTLTDSLCAMVFGLPSHVDYDTIGYIPTSVPVPFEWTHSSPAEFQIMLADINACRDKRPGARTREDLERQLLAWQTQPSYYGEFWEIWMISAWFVVQESWRLALLAYLYIAVYNRSSDDAEVQLCTQQIFEVANMVKQPESSKASVSFFIQYLIAGICAQADEQRMLVRDQLATVSTTRLWMMRGRDFLPVLEHLWQGAAVEGRPVKWGDYLDSREARWGTSTFATAGFIKDTHVGTSALLSQQYAVSNLNYSEYIDPGVSYVQNPAISDSRLSAQNVASHSGALTPTEHCALSLALCPTKLKGDSSLQNAASLQHLIALFTRLPYDPFQPTEVYLNSSYFEGSVSAHCHRMVEITYFKPVQLQLAQIQRSIISRLHHSKYTRWIMFLCGTVSESFAKGDTLHNQIYSRWIADTEQSIRSTLTGNVDSREVKNRLGDWLEILLLKTMVVESSNSYQMLRSAAPTFLRVVFSDPTLWPAKCDSTLVPLPNVIVSARHELAYFALVDSTCAMAFGFPQTVEYDASLGNLPPISNPHECIHGPPAEFQIALTQINACRDRSPNAHDWKEIELWLLTWQARPIKYSSGWESWMVVAWLAVQESWRHTLLAYLYMSVCGTTSGDEKVRSSVRQILQILETVRKQQALDTEVNVPCFLQYLMAGICSQNEKHRAIVRKKLGDICGTHLWLMRGTDFVPVLDHLWHGAAADGRPITWGDYLSREIALPVIV